MTTDKIELMNAVAASSDEIRRLHAEIRRLRAERERDDAMTAPYEDRDDEVAELRDALGICHAAMKRHDFDITGTVPLKRAVFSSEREIVRKALGLSAEEEKGEEEG